jgi:spore germination cell wall hydrolase CwlJ-like protein
LAEGEARRQEEIKAVKAEIHAETLARKEAESKAQAVEKALQEAKSKAHAADEARQEAEFKVQVAEEALKEAELKVRVADEARQEAELKAQTTENAKQEAESKTKVVEEATSKKQAETKAQKQSETKADERTYVKDYIKVSPDTKVTDNTLLQRFLSNNGLTMDDFVVTLTRVVYAEACGEQWAGKVGVAEVYLNWIEADEFHYLSEFENGYARISLEEYYEVKWSSKEEDRAALQECERAVRAAIAGESPVEQLLGGVKPYYFFLPQLSDPANVYVLEKATYQIWVGNQLYTGLEGVDWTLKTQYYQYQP